MAKVEDDFMQHAPENFDDIKRFIKGTVLDGKTARRKVPLYVPGIYFSSIPSVR